MRLVWVSKTTIFIGLFIVISASFMRQLMGFLKACAGKENFGILIGLILLMAGLAFLIFIIKNNAGLGRISIALLILLTGLFLAWQMKIPEEKIHILEYGLLGYFAARDLMKSKKNTALFFALILIMMVGFLDEIFQKVLPYRVGDLRDIGFDTLGGVWGIVLYLTGRTPIQNEKD